MPITDKQIELFASLFRGREDVYARRWTKGNKSGYMPAYEVDWKAFEKHKALGGTFKDFEHKKHACLTRSVLRKHLFGGETIGIYPLLKDNTSWFLAADFDGDKWRDESSRFINACIKMELPVLLERSRSGQGGHVWIFFKDPYPAWKSRKIAFQLLRKAGIISDFEKVTGFDRLFPNQDYHTGAGFGNLIALPLNGKSISEGNTCFIDPQSGQPFKKQWEILEEAIRISASQLDMIYNLMGDSFDEPAVSYNPSNNKVELVIDRQIWLNKNNLSPALVLFLREQLNFVNSAYQLQKNLGRSTFKTEKYFKLIGEESGWINIPRGFIDDLISYCKDNHVAYQITDRRRKGKPAAYTSGINLYPYQEEALKTADKKDHGVIVAPPGTGKTIMGLELIARRKQPALIIVHRKQLMDQWIDRIQTFLGIPKHEIGRFAGSVKKTGKQITVGMIQTLHRTTAQDKSNEYGTIIVDECHHMPAKMFREAIAGLNSFYLYGLTATPMRKNNDEALIYVFIGPILHEITSDFLNDQKEATIRVHIRETSLSVPFNYKTDEYEVLSQILVHDTNRNRLITEDLTQMADQKKSILVLTERKAHIDVLNLYLKKRFETIALSGDDSKRSQQSKMDQIKAGHFQIVLTTGQYFGEGIDIDSFDCLFLVYPFAFKGKLIQYIGRIARTDKLPVIFDYRDIKIDYFEKLFKKRNSYYEKIRKANQMTLGF